MSCVKAWLNWEAWGGCSTTCREGNQHRTRECNSDTDPDHFNGPCTGRNTETKLCDRGPCMSKSIHVSKHRAMI